MTREQRRIEAILALEVSEPRFLPLSSSPKPPQRLSWLHIRHKQTAQADTTPTSHLL